MGTRSKPSSAAAVGSAAPRGVIPLHHRVYPPLLQSITGRSVTPCPEWAESLRRTAADPAAARAYLRAAAMLDMLDRTDDA